MYAGVPKRRWLGGMAPCIVGSACVAVRWRVALAWSRSRRERPMLGVGDLANAAAWRGLYGGGMCACVCASVWGWGVSGLQR